MAGSPSRLAASAATPGALGTLLARSARGDVEAFAQFYDATSTHVFRLALARARACGLGDDPARAAAERETTRRFARAWRRAHDQPSSGLSPLPWLLAIPASALEPVDPGAGEQAACA